MFKVFFSVYMYGMYMYATYTVVGLDQHSVQLYMYTYVMQCTWSLCMYSVHVCLCFVCPALFKFMDCWVRHMPSPRMALLCYCSFHVNTWINEWMNLAKTLGYMHSHWSFVSRTLIKFNSHFVSKSSKPLEHNQYSPTALCIEYTVD